MAEGGIVTTQAPAARAHWLNAERVRVYSWIIVAIFGTMLVVWVAMALPDLVDRRGKPLGYDFMAFWSAARLALAGHAATAFEGSAITAVQHAAVPLNPDIWFPWHYPPTFLLAVVPLGLVPYPVALAGFVLVTAALYAALVRQVLPDRRAWIVAAATPAVLINLLDGQNAFLTVALAGFGLLWLDRRPVTAGVLIGLLALKPHLAVLFPLALLAEGRWRTIVAAAATLLLLVAASYAAFGSASWAAFIEHLPVSQAMADAGAVPWGTMPSPYVFVLSLGGSVSVARIAQILVALVAAACVWRAWRRRDAPFEAKTAVVMAASLLVSPYLFYYDLLWAALGVGWLALLGLRQGFRRGEREILLLAWAAPAIMQPVQMLTAVQIGFPAVLLLLLVAMRRAAPPEPAEAELLQRAIQLLREARWLNHERVMRWGGGLALMSLGIGGFDVVMHTQAGVTNGDGEQLGRDFINFWAGARAAAAGDAARVYEVPWFNAFQQATTGEGAELKVYSYPPTAMLLALPFAALPFVPALIAWVGLGVGWCIALLRRLLPVREAWLAMLAAPAVLLNFVSGQNGCFTAGLLAGGLMALSRRPVLAGICFGCLCYKPQLAVLLPVALIASGRWRAFIAAGVTAAALVALSLVLFGDEAWVRTIGQAATQRRFLELGVSFWHRMPTVFVAVRVLGAAAPMAYVVQALAAIAAIAAVVAVWRSPASFGIKAAALIVATFLATPYAWDYDEVVLVFAAAWLAREARQSGFRPWERLAVVALLVSPFITMVAVKLAGLPLGPVPIAAMLAVLTHRALADHQIVSAPVVTPQLMPPIETGEPA